MHKHANFPAPPTPPAAPTPPANGGLFGMAGNLAGNALAKAPGATGAFAQTLQKHNVPVQDWAGLHNDYRQLQQNYTQGNYLNAYQGGMGLMGKLRGYNPNLPQAMGPLVGQHAGPGAGTAWNMMGAWHNMVGDPGRFAQLSSGIAPGLMRAAGTVGGLAGPLAMYGMVSGNQSVMKDLRNVVGMKSSSVLAYHLLPR